MKFLFVERNAVEQIATTRALQSSEFEQSRELSSFLKVYDSKVVDGIAFHVKKDGAFIYSLKLTNCMQLLLSFAIDPLVTQNKFYLLLMEQ